MIHALLATVLIAQGPATRVQQPSPRVIHQEMTPFGSLFVVDDKDMRYLRFDSAVGDDQSMISLKDSHAVPMDYVRFAAVGLGYVRGADRLLMVGLGGGTFSTLVHRVLPEMRIDVVEVNPAVLRVAEAYFGVSRDQRLQVHIDDGRRYIEHTKNRYDLIMLDAYSGDGIPNHLVGGDFFALVKRRLNPAGALVTNLSVAAEQEGRLIDLIEREVGPVDCFRTPDRLNLIVVAKPAGRLEPHQLAVKIAKLDQELELPFELRRVATMADAGCQMARAP